MSEHRSESYPDPRTLELIEDEAMAWDMALAEDPYRMLAAEAVKFNLMVEESAVDRPKIEKSEIERLGMKAVSAGLAAKTNYVKVQRQLLKDSRSGSGLRHLGLVKSRFGKHLDPPEQPHRTEE